MVNSPEVVKTLLDDDYLLEFPRALAGLYKRRGTKSSFEDLVSQGNIGLVEAACRWDGRGTFAGFAYRQIFWKMGREDIYLSRAKREGDAYHFSLDVNGEYKDNSRDELRHEDVPRDESIWGGLGCHDAVEHNSLREYLHECIDSILKPFERIIIRELYFAKRSTREVARTVMNPETGRFVSRSRVHELKESALQKLRVYFSSKDFLDYLPSSA